MNNIKSFTVTIMCPITTHPQTMQIRYVDRDVSKRVYFPCDRCCAALTLMFHRGYEHTPGKTITLDFEALK